MRIRRMHQEDEREVRKIYARCHPTWPERSEHWFFVNPTLVVGDARGIAGFASLSITTSTGLVLAQGMDICVHPAYRRMGLGGMLWDARSQVARSVGATMISGATQPENIVMRRIILARGLHYCQTIPHYYPDGEDALLFFGPILGPEKDSPPWQ